MSPSAVSNDRQMPEGTVTFLFSDVEGSTNLLESYGDASGRALLRHHELFEELVRNNRGVIFETVGDAVYAAFASPADAVASALKAHRALAAEAWAEVGGRLACRIALHTGAVERRGNRYFGPPLFRCARLEALAYGEQTLVSAATAALVGVNLPQGARMVDRGVYRLKDLLEPEHVFELQHPDLRTEFPPLRSLDARRNNLPSQLSSFVGRDAELATVKTLVEEHRLVTLLGPGGIGKTRLALQAAAEAIDGFPEGAWLVDLASLADAEAVPAAIAAAIGLEEQPNRSVLDQLRTELAERKLLLILDNLEQLLPGAAGIVADLMAAAPDLHVLATSRAPLRIRGELEHPVPPLSAGSPTTPNPELPPAVALFLDRAVAAGTGIEVTPATGPLIAAICDRLDGLPLAIELAAARLRLFGLQALHDRLAQRLPVLIGGARDLPERQQTLAATIAWSDELLGEAERRLFHRLAIFTGGFGLAGAEAVADAGVDEALTTLLEQSLVLRTDAEDEPRFRMLETIREYALEALDREGDAALTRDRMVDHVCDLARPMPEELVGQHQARALRQLDAELPNIRTTLDLLWERSDGSRLPPLVADLARYWTMRGQRTEGMTWTERALALVPDEPSDLRGRLRWAEARLWVEAETERALLAAESAISIFERTGNKRELAISLLGLSLVCNTREDAEGSMAAAKRGEALAREVGDLRSEGVALGNWSYAAWLAGRTDEAEDALRRATEIMRRVGDDDAVAGGLSGLATFALQRGETDAAMDLYLEAVAIARRVGDPEGLGAILISLVFPHVASGRWQLAVEPWLEAMSLFAEVQMARGLVAGLSIATPLLRAAGDIEGAATAWAHAQVHVRKRGTRIDRSDIDTAAVEAVLEELGDAYRQIERRVADIPLTEAVDTITERVHALTNPR